MLDKYYYYYYVVTILTHINMTLEQIGNRIYQGVSPRRGQERVFVELSQENEIDMTTSQFLRAVRAGLQLKEEPANFDNLADAVFGNFPKNAEVLDKVEVIAGKVMLRLVPDRDQEEYDAVLARYDEALKGSKL